MIQFLQVFLEELSVTCCLEFELKENRINKKNIQFHLAIIRYFFKAFLGIISLVTVSGNEKKRAIHDHLIGSVVVSIGILKDDA